MGEIADRKLDTEARLVKLREQLQEAESIAKTKACVYATGSFGRLEASPYSDLDLFIVGKSDDRGVNFLKRLDEICIKADLIEVTRKLGIPEFSGDGRYLVNYSVSELTKTLGTPKDDVENTFTARLLLLLESRPLLEEAAYADITRDVIAAYWRDYEDHGANFMPAFLANDILRLWRTFCVNYEARTERVPDEEKAKGKLKNYKLKHSRLLTCYSALLYLLAVYRLQGTVSPPDAIAMINMTPTGRLQWLLDQSDLKSAHDALSMLLSRYEVFLQATNDEESQLVRRFMDKSISRENMDAAYKFGDIVYQALIAIGNGSGFQRLLIV